MDYADLLKDFGPLIGVVLFFIWRDWKREENLVERVQKLEDFNTEVLTNLVKEQATTISTCTQVIAANTEVIKTNTEQNRQIIQAVAFCRAKQDG
jgi:hypothetical protein